MRLVPADHAEIPAYVEGRIGTAGRRADTVGMSRVMGRAAHRTCGALLVLALLGAARVGAGRTGQDPVTDERPAAAVGRSAGPAVDGGASVAVGRAASTLEDAGRRRMPASTPAVRETPSTVPSRSLLVTVRPGLEVTSRPGAGRDLGTFPTVSKYYGAPLEAWVMRVAQNGRYGEVAVPFSPTHAIGWIRLSGLRRSRTNVFVEVSVSEHRLSVYREARLLSTFPAATGAPASPTPPGRYFLTDRVPLPCGGAFGCFAFGISGIQTRLPPGWSGGDQLAIHGTNEPWTIGRSRSAGCLRVSTEAVSRLLPLLRLGTPVVITR